MLLMFLRLSIREAETMCTSRSRVTPWLCITPAPWQPMERSSIPASIVVSHSKPPSASVPKFKIIQIAKSMNRIESLHIPLHVSSFYFQNIENNLKQKTGRVIKGWDEGVPQMSKGESAVLHIKSE